QATDPPLGNVEIEAYEVTTNPATGFVVCFVPEGPFKPYRTEDGRRSQWYIRAGDNFVIMSRSVLQTMFYPRSKAVFRARGVLTWELLDKQATGGRDIASMSCALELVNDGNATARNAMVLLSANINASSLEAKPAPPDLPSGLWAGSRMGSSIEFEAFKPLHP